MSFNSSCTRSVPRSHCRCWRHWVTANVRTPPCVPMCTRSDVNTNVNCPLCEQFPNTRETRHSIVHCVAPQACNCHQIRLNRQHNEHFTGKTNKGCRGLHCQHIRRPFYLFKLVKSSDKGASCQKWHFIWLEGQKADGYSAFRLKFLTDNFTLGQQHSAMAGWSSNEL